jgi:hypothetical protein
MRHTIARLYKEREKKMVAEARATKAQLDEAVADPKPAKASAIKVGTKLRLVRRPIYARKDAPAERQSTKTVARVSKTSDGHDLVLSFKGVYFPGTKALNAYRGSVRDGELVELWGDKARYDVIGIV